MCDREYICECVCADSEYLLHVPSCVCVCVCARISVCAQGLCICVCMYVSELVFISPRLAKKEGGKEGGCIGLGVCKALKTLHSSS